MCREVHILAQHRDIVERIVQGKDTDFHPHCVEAFEELAQKEAFWLDGTSKRVYAILLNAVPDAPIDATNQAIGGIAEIFARIVDSMSRWTATHSAGVAASAVALAEEMRLSLREQIHMKTAGLLHDLGKLVVPPEILDHPGSIPDRKWAPIKAHPYHTYHILETTGFPAEIVEWAGLHHERLDGTGYPFHLTEEDLTLGSRIMAISDVFTALTEVRPYRKGLSREDTVASLRQMVHAGGLDGDVVHTLAANYEYIDSTRRKEQKRYADRQKRLAEIMTDARVPVG